MSRVRIGLRWLVSFAVGSAVVFFLIGASATLPTATGVVYANPIPACGTAGVTCVGNAEFFNFGDFPQGNGGGCGHGATLTILNDSLGVGFELSNIGGNAVCTLSSTSSLPGTASISASIEVAGINGYLIDGINGSMSCGISGSVVSGGLTLDPGLGAGSAATVSCPQLPLGSTMLETGSSTFTPTAVLTETITLSATGIGGPGALSIQSVSDQFSLLPPSSVPEPGTLVLFAAGVIGLLATTRKRAAVGRRH